MLRPAAIYPPMEKDSTDRVARLRTLLETGVMVPAYYDALLATPVADTGSGNALSVQRTVRMFERLGSCVPLIAAMAEGGASSTSARFLIKAPSSDIERMAA